MHSVSTTNKWTVSTLFKYRFSGNSVINRGQIFSNVQKAVYFNRQNTRVDRILSIAKKTLLRKKYQKQLLCSFQKTKSTQNSGSVFADRIEQVKKTKLDLELIKTAEFFVDGHGNFTSNLISLKKSS